MTVSAVSDATFESEVLQCAEPVLVDFWAEWCGPCKAMAPALEQVAKEMQGKLKVVKLDVDRAGDTAEKYGIRAMPTLILFKNGKPAARHSGALVQKAKLAQWINSVASAPESSLGAPAAVEFKLASGLHLVVLAKPGASPLIHRTFYKVGADDDPQDLPGIASFVGRLMSAEPGNLDDHVLTSTEQDVTFFLQRILKDQLKLAMEKEAGRMTSLRHSEEDVAALRQRVVALISRKAPGARLKAQMDAALDQPPMFGKSHDIASLSRDDVVRFHKRYYAPNNAVLVVAGDVLPEEVKQLAEEVFANIPANPQVGGRTRAKRVSPEAARHIILKDPQVKKGMSLRTYLVPSHVSAKPGEAEALELLAQLLGGRAGILNRKLADGKGPATSASLRYSGWSLGTAAIELAVDGDPEAVDAATDEVLEEIRSQGIAEPELERAKARFAAAHAGDSDDTAALAKRYGLAMAFGLTVADVEAWPAAMAKVTAADIKRVAEAYLDPRRSVTGWLVPEPVTAVA
jgi:zinc protease